MRVDTIVLTGLVLMGQAGATCDFRLAVNDALQYPVTRMVAESGCETITVTVVHQGTLGAHVMGHNWVLAKTADVQGVALDGMRVGAGSDYLQPGDPRVVAATRIVGAGESASTSFSPRALQPGESYSFFSSFPANWTLMSGEFVLR